MAKPGTIPRVSELTRAQKAAQVLGMSFYSNTELDRARPNRLAQFVARNGLGLIHLAHGELGQTRRWVDHLDGLARKATSVPILFGADCEQGLPHSFAGGTPLPWQMAIGSSQDPHAAFEAGAILGAEGRAIGLDLIFGPVADVNNNAQNRVIANRAFGGDPKLVSALVQAFVEGLHAGGALSVLKHFPGHGSTTEDSHLAVPYDFSEREEIEQLHLPPFRAGFAAGAAGIMTGHMVMCALDDENPATLSPACLRELLRGELGFEGVAITDSLNMAGLENFVPRPEAVVRALEAGADIVLHPSSLERASTDILRALDEGRLDEALLDEAVERVLALKRRCVPGRIDAKRGAKMLEREASSHTRRAQASADGGVTLLSNPPHLPLPKGPLELVVALDDGGRRIEVASSFVDAVTQARPASRVHNLYETTAAKTLDTMKLELAARSAPIVLAVLCPMMFFKGRSRLSPALARHLRQLLSGLSAPHSLVLFGVPYAAHGLPGIQRLCAYGPTAPSQRAAAKVLLGELTPNTHIPVPWPGYE